MSTVDYIRNTLDFVHRALADAMGRTKAAAATPATATPAGARQPLDRLVPMAHGAD